MSRVPGHSAPRTVKMNKANQLKALLACTTEEAVRKLVEEYPDLFRHNAFVPKFNAVRLLAPQLSPAMYKAESFRPQFRQEKADLLRKVMEDGKAIYCYGQSGTGRTHWFKTFFGADMRVCGGSVSVDDILRGLNKWPNIIQWDIIGIGGCYKKEELLNFVSPEEVPWIYSMKIPDSYYIPKNVCRIINTVYEPNQLLIRLGSTPDEIDKFMANIYVWKVENFFDMLRDPVLGAPRTVKMNEADQLKTLLACTTEEEVLKLVEEYPDLNRHSVFFPKLSAVRLLAQQLSPAMYKAESFRPQFRQEKADLLRKVMEGGKAIYCYGKSPTGRYWFKTFFRADMRVYGGRNVCVEDILRGLNKWPKIIQWNIYDGSSLKKEELLSFVSPGEVPWLSTMKIPESYYIPKHVCRIINTWLEPKELMTLLGLTPDEIDKFTASIYVWKVDLSLLENETTKIGLAASVQGPKRTGNVPIDFTAEQTQGIVSGASKRKRT